MTSHYLSNYCKGFITNTEQGILDPAGTETFAKEPKFAKLLRELKLTLASYNKKGPLVSLAGL